MRTAIVSRSVLAALAAIILSVLVPAAAAPPPVQAAWVNRHVQFFYQSFTTRYTCSGLRSQIVHMLHQLGARDLRVRSVGCARLRGPESSPGVDVTMQVLVPAARAPAGSPHVAAHWRKAVLLSGMGSLNQAGDCDLAEQFRRTILPVFTTRKVVLHASCVPHQIDIGTYLSAQVLFADLPAAPKR
jgi:hypothetical protein